MWSLLATCFWDKYWHMLVSFYFFSRSRCKLNLIIYQRFYLIRVRDEIIFKNRFLSHWIRIVTVIFQLLLLLFYYLGRYFWKTRNGWYLFYSSETENARRDDTHKWCLLVVIIVCGNFRIKNSFDGMLSTCKNLFEFPHWIPL